MDQIAVLGPIEARVSDARVVILSPRQRALLARLVLDRGIAVAADTLVEDAWGDRVRPRDARASLQVQVHRLRALLGPLGAHLITVSAGYRLDIPPEQIDSHLFESRVREGRELLRWNPRDALTVYDDALSRWRGRAYAEFADTFAQPEAVRLHHMRDGAREERLEALLALGETTRAVAEAEALISAEPLREGPYGLAMRALTLAGRRSEALSIYQRLRHLLAEELGSEPSPGTRAVHLSVLRQEEAPSVAITGGPTLRQARIPDVPAPLNTCVGRQNDLDALDRAVAASRMVTLVGPPGVGKTRLAQEWAQTATARGKVAWVNLTGARNGVDIPHAVLDAIGCPPADRGEVTTETVLKAMADQNLTVVVDNCEHLVDQVAGLLAAVQRTCPAVRIVATSRERLAVEGEHVLVVAPLDTGLGPNSPAIRLFLDRVAAAGHPLDDLNPGVIRSVTRLCQRLDGLPLALELAAANTATLGLASTVGCADLLWLASGRRSDRQSHRSLRSALAWSYDRLSVDEQRVLRRLAVFAGWFSVPWAAQVCADADLPPQRVPAVLASLVEKSLVGRRPEPAPGGRGHALLHTVRSFAGERLDEAGESDHLRARHARTLAGWAEDLTGGEAVRMPAPRQPAPRHLAPTPSNQRPVISTAEPSRRSTWAVVNRGRA
ncbi:AAA family ATPase [Micromonospora sp. BRA006-A]|uniref:AfsR/SARP family transcriptional regulator n=1 Tax=Micromonospora sp. BRA006-A TaxID=2962860 RepID=UPI00297005B3|nr:BTAD domain-containing putative transcriptional regulator [Micromonospora sp. BRA006-A]MDW3845679.1 AAA family ATPase [Micromonospora sp. BRA006-A]